MVENEGQREQNLATVAALKGNVVYSLSWSPAPSSLRRSSCTSALYGWSSLDCFTTSGIKSKKWQMQSTPFAQGWDYRRAELLGRHACSRMGERTSPTSFSLAWLDSRWLGKFTSTHSLTYATSGRGQGHFRLAK